MENRFQIAFCYLIGITPTFADKSESEKSAIFSFLSRDIAEPQGPNAAPIEGGAASPPPALAPASAGDEALSGALVRCEARVKRLDRLNALLESFSSYSWAVFVNNKFS